MLITILGSAAITVLWIQSEPTNYLKHFIYKKVKDKDILWHWRLINCALCSGFWIGLVITQNIFLAAIISISSELINKKLTEGGL